MIAAAASNNVTVTCDKPNRGLELAITVTAELTATPETQRPQKHSDRHMGGRGVLTLT